MNQTKLLTGILLVLAVLFTQVGTAFAAPVAQEATSIIGTIVSVTPDPTTQTVLVDYTDESGQPQSVRVSYATAEGLGLITVDPLTGEATVVAAPGDSVTIDPTSVIPDQEEQVHPIAAILASFFGMEPGAVNDLHEEGFGFGVIAQALWMSQNLTGTEDTMGDASLATDILTAKQNKNYDAFFEAHPEYLDQFEDGAPTNWGQFKKGLLDKKNNLGVIVSGHADQTTEDSRAQQNNGNGRGNGRNNNPGRGNGRNNHP